MSQELRARVGGGYDARREPTDPPTLPPGVVVADGCSADEAVAIAIWNSPAFRVELTRLRVAEAELAGAKRPSNPTLRLLFPAGPQQLGALVTWPLETLIMLPRRVKIARKNLAEVAQSLVQVGTDLARDAKLAHVEWRLAHERVRVRQVIAQQWSEIAAVVRARAEAGDVAPAEVDAADADAMLAADDAARAELEVTVAASRLAARIGYPDAVRLVPDDGAAATEPPPPADRLTALALASRADLRAAAIAIDAASLIVGLERASVFTLAGVVSGNGAAYTGGVQAEIPLASQNQAGRGRAKGRQQAARWRYQELALRIGVEVTQARAQLTAAQRSSSLYHGEIVDARQRELATATARYRAGESDYGGVLLSAQRLEQTRLREVELDAEVRRAHAELERATGGRLAALERLR
ncbi:MAG: TolC family protein [Nannocystaceae bacterium]|nr:TolC family protein [Nannocystaceae bacterium]